MNGAIRLGRFVGVDVVADVSSFLLALLFGGAVFISLRQSFPDASAEAIGISATIAGVAVVVCVFAHEASHVLAAIWRGLSVRSIRLYMFGGYSVIDGVPSPGTEFVVAAAGPVASLIIGVAAMSGPYLVGTDTLVGATLWAVGLFNLALGVFNLLPGFPLDGARIVRSVLSMGDRDRVRATRVVVTIGRLLGVASMIIGAYLLATRQPTGLFWMVGGWFLASSAVTAGKREELSAAFDGVAVADVMRSTHDAVDGNSTISDVLALYAIGPRLASQPVQMEGRVIGVIGQDEIDSVAPSRWPSMRARVLMSRIGPQDVVEADAPLDSLLLRPAGASRRAVVVKDGTVVGIVDGAALGRALGRV
jgi:Zn-dependent protease/predicted transcriptional regulator